MAAIENDRRAWVDGGALMTAEMVSWAVGTEEEPGTRG